MFVVLDPADDAALPGPLSTIEIRAHRTADPAADATTSTVRPLALRKMRPAPQRDIPKYVYDPRRQIATDPDGRPLAPDLKKDWTTIEGTHTDGDGGDNELWDWEEIT